VGFCSCVGVLLVLHHAMPGCALISSLANNCADRAAASSLLEYTFTQVVSRGAQHSSCNEACSSHLYHSGQRRHSNFGPLFLSPFHLFFQHRHHIRRRADRHAHFRGRSRTFLSSFQSSPLCQLLRLILCPCSRQHASRPRDHNQQLARQLHHAGPYAGQSGQALLYLPCG
jgi:hypothetical protein